MAAFWGGSARSARRLGHAATIWVVFKVYAGRMGEQPM